MNWDQIQGNWKQYKNRVKQQWVHLTEEDLTLIDGRRDQLANCIQDRYGYAKDEADREIDWFCHNCTSVSTAPVNGQAARNLP